MGKIGSKNPIFLYKKKECLYNRSLQSVAQPRILGLGDLAACGFVNALIHSGNLVMALIQREADCGRGEPTM